MRPKRLLLAYTCCLTLLLSALLALTQLYAQHGVPHGDTFVLAGGGRPVPRGRVNDCRIFAQENGRLGNRIFPYLKAALAAADVGVQACMGEVS